MYTAKKTMTVLSLAPYKPPPSLLSSSGFVKAQFYIPTLNSPPAMTIRKKKVHTED